MLYGIKIFVMVCSFFIWTRISEAYTWYGYEGHSYALTEQKKSWQESEQEAVSEGGHLSTINDSIEQGWLVQTFGGHPNSFWIGFYQLPGSDEPDKGWIWISNEQVTFTNWASGEPNNGSDGTECYATMNEHADGLWNDLPPTFTHRGIIEVVPLPSALLLLSSGLVGLGLLGRWRKRG